MRLPGGTRQEGAAGDLRRRRTFLGYRSSAMLRFSANVSLMFPEFPFPDRFGEAARAGFAAVECQFPYAFPRERLAEAVSAHGLALVLHNLPAGDWEAGERGIACLPGREGEFQDGVGRAIDYAAALGCAQLNCLAGLTPPDVDQAKIERTLIDNLRFAARAASAASIRLLVEPLNSFDFPGFHLTRTADVLALFAKAGEENLWLQYDVYHRQRMQGELTGTLRRDFKRIAHIQLADNPGRHEPGTGEINFPFLFAELARLGYSGWVGCEYIPKTTTLEGLGWLREAKTARKA